jgi:hypothetical protein
MIDKHNCKVIALEIIKDYHRDGGCFNNELLDFRYSEKRAIVAKYAGSDCPATYRAINQILRKWWYGQVARWGLPECNHCATETI